MVESELVGLPGKVLIRGTTGRLRFVVHAADKLHCMVLNQHGDVGNIVHNEVR